MKKPHQRLCASLLCLAASIFMPQVQAQPPTAPGTRMGCVFQGPTGKTFIDAQRSRDQIAADLKAAYAGSGSSRVADACLAGQLANMPAAVYQNLASKHPGKYAPLSPQASSTNSVGPAPAARGPRNLPLNYAFIALDSAIPSGFLFFDPIGVSDSHKVIGTVYDNDGNPSLALYQSGMVEIMIAGAFVNAVSRQGVAAGAVVTDPINFYTQAAIFHGSSTELIPRAPDEVTSYVASVTDQGTALVMSTDATGINTAYLYQNRKLRKLTFASANYVVLTGMNNALTIVGWLSTQPNVDTAFKFDANTGTTTLLPPLASNPSSWAIGINNLGDIVGYSFVFSGTENIGIWSGGRPFETYFTEGTAQIPTISNWLLINDARLIVITRTNDQQSYLIPTKGTRVLLSDYVNYDVATYGTLSSVVGLNNFAELTGLTSFSYNFFLKP